MSGAARSLHTCRISRTRYLCTGPSGSAENDGRGARIDLVATRDSTRFRICPDLQILPASRLLRARRRICKLSDSLRGPCRLSAGHGPVHVFGSRAADRPDYGRGIHRIDVIDDARPGNRIRRGRVDGLSYFHCSARCPGNLALAGTGCTHSIRRYHTCLSRAADDDLGREGKRPRGRRKDLRHAVRGFFRPGPESLLPAFGSLCRTRRGIRSGPDGDGRHGGHDRFRLHWGEECAAPGGPNSLWG